MTKYMYICMMILTTILCSSCSSNQDDIFDESPSTRIKNTNQKVKELLESSSNGWSLDLFTATGGTNLLLKFVDGKVTAADYRDGISSDESFYSMIQNGGPVLSFNTYNSVIHAYSDPVSPGNNKGDNEGLGADFEFVVTSYSTDTIELRGLKHQRMCRLTRYKQDVSWETTLNTLSTMNEDIQAPLYAFYSNGQQVVKTNSINNNVLTTYQISGLDTIMITVPIVPTLDGFRTAYPFSYEAHDSNPKIQHFTFSKKMDRFVCVDSGVDFYIQKAYPPLNKVWTESTNRWWFNASFINDTILKEMSADFAILFTNFHSTDCVPFGEKLYGGYMGYNESYPNDVNEHAFVFYSLKSTGSGYWKGVVGYTCTKVEGTNDQVVFSKLNPTLNKAYYPHAQTIGQEFVEKGPWVITVDNKKAPTSFTFTSTQDSSLYITVSQ